MLAEKKRASRISNFDVVDLAFFAIFGHSVNKRWRLWKIRLFGKMDK